MNFLNNFGSTSAALFIVVVDRTTSKNNTSIISEQNCIDNIKNSGIKNRWLHVVLLLVTLRGTDIVLEIRKRTKYT